MITDLFKEIGNRKVKTKQNKKNQCMTGEDFMTNIQNMEQTDYGTHIREKSNVHDFHALDQIYENPLHMVHVSYNTCLMGCLL